MWISDVEDQGSYYILLLHIGDKNVAGMSLVDFQTMAARDIEKADEEGGLYSSHILIHKGAEDNGRHVAMIEKVPGVHLSSVKDHLTWCCNSAGCTKEAPSADGSLKEYRPIFVLDGYQSRTVSEAIAKGTLKDVEFVSIEENYQDGIDEQAIIEEVVKEARWTINKKVPASKINALFDFLKSKKPDGDVKMFVRIKTDSGQIKSTEVDPDSEQMLEAAFVQNEVVAGFNVPLPARHDNILPQMVEKII